MFFRRIFALSLFSLPTDSTVAFNPAADSKVDDDHAVPAFGIIEGEARTSSALFPANQEIEVMATDDSILQVKAPLKFIGPYPCLGLRFPELATSGQRKQGKTGVSLDFLLDTAANTNTIQGPIAKELEVPGNPLKYDMGPSQLDGIMKDIFLTSLPAVIGTPNPHAAGLLSLAFFNLFQGGVEFQWAGKKAVTFWSGKTAEATAGKRMVPIEPLTHAGNLPTIQLEINGKKVRALLSTGSPITVMNEAAAKLARVSGMDVSDDNKQKLMEEGHVITIMDEKAKPVELVKSNKPVDVQAGEEVEFGKVPLYVGRIPGMSTLTKGTEDEAAIVLGLDVLVQRPAMLLRAQDNEVWFR